MEDLVDKYLRPQNCEILVSPKVNKVVWHHLKQGTKTADSAIQKCKKLCISSMYAIILAYEKSTMGMFEPH